MNEITQIHLGRQAFTIANNAHKELQEYLHAIEKTVGKKGEEVVKEVENRMAELLTERGVTGDKVVLAEDVAYLKEQLGSPKDFTDKDEESDESEQMPADEQGTKRLFRDTDRGIIAGVAAGLAKYFKVDPVFVRIGFVVLTLFWGWGILLYVLLWLIVPEAKSSSNRLQMEGKAVTVQSLKDVVHRADVPGAANRAGRKVGHILEKTGKVLLAIIGVGFILTGCALFLAPASAGIYLLTNGAEAFGEKIFPLGATETWLVVSGVVTAAVLSILCSLVGLAMIRRKFPVPGWAVAAMIGVVLASASVGLALGLESAPSIAKRVDSLKHTQEVKVAAFKNIELTGSQARFYFVPSNTHSVDLQYMGKQKIDTSSVATVNGDTLTVDAKSLLRHDECKWLCLGNERWVEVTIHAPSLATVTINGINNTFVSNEPLGANATIRVGNGSEVTLMNMVPENAEVEIGQQTTPTTLRLSGIRPSLPDDTIYVYGQHVRISKTENLHLKTSYNCPWPIPNVHIDEMPKQIAINDDNPIKTEDELEARKIQEHATLYNCVGVGLPIYD